MAYERIPVEVSLDTILNAWAKDFTHKDGEIVGTTHYVDVVRGKVCFILTVDKKDK